MNISPVTASVDQTQHDHDEARRKTLRPKAGNPTALTDTDGGRHPREEMLGGSHQQAEGASAALLIISQRYRVMEGGPDLGQSWAAGCPLGAHPPSSPGCACLRVCVHVHTYIRLVPTNKRASASRVLRCRPEPVATTRARQSNHASHHPPSPSWAAVRGQAACHGPPGAGTQACSFLRLVPHGQGGTTGRRVESTTHHENAPPPLPFAMRGKTPTPSPLQGPRELGSRLHASRGI